MKGIIGCNAIKTIMAHVENLNQSLPPVRAEIISAGPDPRTRVDIIAAAMCITLKQWRISLDFPEPL